MLNSIRSRLSYANVMATIALFIALGGGAYAALGKNTVGSRQIKKGAVKSVDIKNRKGVKGIDVVDDSLTGADIAEKSLVANEAWAEVTPTGAVRKAHNMSSADVIKSTSGPAGTYCITLAAESASVTADFIGGGSTDANLQSKELLADYGATPADLGCPASTPWVVRTFVGGGSPSSVDAYFEILLHGLP
jgi:hypothetical protein